MALADLLWACPVCGLDRGLRTGEEDAACGGCGTRFERVDGARIRAHPPAGASRTRSAAEWVDDLPDPTTLLRPAGKIRDARVQVRFVERYRAIRAGGSYINRIEIFGPSREGTLLLEADRVAFTADEEGAGTSELAWPLLDLDAVQASSRSLQIRGNPHPLASFAFPDDSSFLWEQLLALALQAAYDRAGRGRILELQPRIVTT